MGDAKQSLSVRALFGMPKGKEKFDHGAKSRLESFKGVCMHLHFIILSRRKIVSLLTKLPELNRVSFFLLAVGVEMCEVCYRRPHDRVSRQLREDEAP